MTEADWLAATDPAPMLEQIGGRMSPRERLNFMTGCLRRIWDLLSDGRHRRMVEVAEDLADGRRGEDEFLEAAGELPTAARWGPRGILNFSQLPDWVREAHRALDRLTARDPNGLVRLAASVRGGHSAARVADGHVLHAHAAELQTKVRRAYDRASDAKWRGMGRFAEIEAEARELEHQIEQQTNDLRRQIAADSDAGRQESMTAESAAQTAVLRGVVGNPFRRPSFVPAARTEAVLALTRVVVEDRHTDRLPILADALEEAGFDDRETLAFLRGDPAIARGCWVIDAVLHSGYS